MSKSGTEDVMDTATHSRANASGIVCGKKNQTYPRHRGVLRCRLDPVACGRGVLLQLSNPTRGAFAFIRWRTEEVRISFLSNTVADLKDLQTRIISEPPSKPSQIPLKKKKPQSGADKNRLCFHGKMLEINLPRCASAPFLCWLYGKLRWVGGERGGEVRGDFGDE